MFSALFGHKKVKVSVAQSCPTLCDPVDCSLPGSSVHGIWGILIMKSKALLIRSSNLTECPTVKSQS